ncbi:efflux RND transporter periplasmic adaptor subunit [Leptolyngbya sp. NIES-2104]|uniref:efflux RND transporter periplasmic adaptor subunit n=1 Tax=Leptolyngbya sp. NIES-2104 TaxID=1552121 RepID=UPI0006EC92B9|nr:efflux RND transporter periplasmic adaptor subunit [Leptolyngbya sp. NIES-2104]GAP99476.1 probable Co/Zn/Cd efflux system membrane fusion protein [Leptolyngbya sp. NIES-2104]
MPSLAVSVSISIRRLSATVLTLGALVGSPALVFAHGGHGNEFKGGSTQSSGSVQVDAATAQRLGFKVESVMRQRLAFGIKTTGQIETLPNRQVEVTTPVGGTLLRLLVKPGDIVAAGQPLAVMTSPDLAQLRTTAFDRRSEATGAVQQAEADLQLAQENLDRQRTITDQEVRQAKSAFDFAQEASTKDQQLAQTGALPRRTALESGTKLAEARANLSKAESRLAVSEAQAQLKRAQSALEVARSRVQLSGQAYETRLRQLGANANEDGTITITAPISGAIADREATPGESGQDAGKRILTIVNGSSVQASGNIYEKDLNQIRVGQSVRVKVNGLADRSFNGRISVVGSTVQGETRVVPVKVELDNADGALKPGMFAEIEVLTDRTPVSVLAVPKSAIVETNDKKKIVFVQNGNAFQATDVTLGRESSDFVEVTNGLFDGDKVVTQRAPQLYTQSLRGDTKADAGHSETPTTTAQASNSLPWWLILPAGGAIAVGTFWAGTVWSSRRQRRLQPAVENATPHEAEIYFHSNGSGSKSSAIQPQVEILDTDHNPHQN